MTPEDFEEFFRAVHGGGASEFKPFPWQVRLARQVATTGWVPRLDLPTGSGKSAVIDIAVFALACQADRPAAQRVPLRTFFVVDRRVVVQQAARRAQKVADALLGADHGIVREVAERLRAFGGSVPLAVLEMRGGMQGLSRGIDRLDQPLVTVTTVDQVGSRLLFRGYGVSPEMRPVQAAATCLDALYLLDEAQLSWAFADTVRSVARYAEWADQALMPPPQIVALSATLPHESGAEPFRLGDDDVVDPELGRRLRAGKRAVLYLAGKSVSPEAPEQPLEVLAVRCAQDFAAEGGVVGVVVSRVATARRIFEILRADGADSILLTGRTRPYDRDALLERYGPRLFADERERTSADRLFVVGTQTVEVGADFDWDALVTDLAPLPALFQRFGRLNRRGTLQMAPAAIIRHKDPGVYTEAALNEAWDWLQEHRNGKGKGATVDLSPVHLEELRRAGQVPTLEVAPSPAIPPRYVELWVHTSPPSPHPDPDIAPYLHGALRGSADVSLVWRSDLTHEDLQRARTSGEWLEYCTQKVALLPPRSAEALQIPVWEARAWLSEMHRRASSLADVEGAGEDPSDESEGDQGSDRPALCWRGKDDTRVLTATGIRPGDVLVVPATYGGADEFGWNPGASSSVSDVADPVAASSGARVVRLHPLLLAALTGVTDVDALRGSLRDLVAALGEVPARQWGGMLDAFLTDLDTTDASALAARGALGQGEPKVIAYPVAPGDSAPGGLVLRYPRQSNRPNGLTNDDTETGDAIGLPTTLRRHTRHVLRRTREVARAAGLPATVVHDLRLAALLHDIGKAEPRFQLMLHGGDRVAAARESRMLAKSGMDPHNQPDMERARRRAGLPRGLRHEFISAGMVPPGSPVLGTAHDPELVLHLVGSHHGGGRPFPPIMDDPRPRMVELKVGATTLRGSSAPGLERIGSGWVDRFWRLNRRYGFWGLAFLESLLRTADWQASREEGGSR